MPGKGEEAGRPGGGQWSAGGLVKAESQRDRLEAGHAEYGRILGFLWV